MVEVGFPILPTYIAKARRKKRRLTSNAQTLINNSYAFSNLIITIDLFLIFVGALDNPIHLIDKYFLFFFFFSEAPFLCVLDLSPES